MMVSFWRALPLELVIDNRCLLPLTGPSVQVKTIPLGSFNRGAAAAAVGGGTFEGSIGIDIGKEGLLARSATVASSGSITPSAMLRLLRLGNDKKVGSSSGERVRTVR